MALTHLLKEIVELVLLIDPKPDDPALRSTPGLEAEADYWILEWVEGRQLKLTPQLRPVLWERCRAAALVLQADESQQGQNDTSLAARPRKSVLIELLVKTSPQSVAVLRALESEKN